LKREKYSLFQKPLNIIFLILVFAPNISIDIFGHYSYKEKGNKLPFCSDNILIVFQSKVQKAVEEKYPPK
jgi:hypothetical protein